MLNSTWRYSLGVSKVFCSGNKLEEARGTISCNCLLAPHPSRGYRSKKAALENGESFKHFDFMFTSSLLTPSFLSWLTFEIQ